MSLTDLSVKDFLAETASSSPSTGGGCVSALAGALSAALSAMVANLTDGKKYGDVCGEMRQIAEKAAALKDKLAASVQKDADSFSEYMAALKLPKDTEENIALRRAAMQRGLKNAALVPLETAERALEIFPLAAAVVKRGNQNALSDGLVSAMLAKTAVYGALFNVRINLGGIKDAAFAEEIFAKTDEIKKQAEESEREILRSAELSAAFV